MAEDLVGIGKAVSALSQPIQGFLSTVLGPASAEVGELFADNIRFVRWKNTIRIVEKAQKEMEARGIQPKEVPLKTLFPILEGASLESDNENLQSKWANLLTSAASGHSSRPSYPKILSEIVYHEAIILDYLYPLELQVAAKYAELRKIAQQRRKSKDYSAYRKREQEIINQFSVPLGCFRLSEIRKQLDFESAESFSESIDNLLRLMLCRYPEEVSEVDVVTSAALSKYEKKAIPDFPAREEDYELDVDEESVTSRVVDENSIRLTNLGKGFMKACQ